MDTMLDEAAAPAKEMDSLPPSAQVQMAANRARMAETMKKLAWLRQGHDSMTEPVNPNLGGRING